MLVYVTGGEKLKIFMMRYGITTNNIIKIIGKRGKSPSIVSFLIFGNRKPNLEERRKLHLFSTRITSIGKYRLALSQIGWDSKTAVELFIYEILFLWKWRHDITCQKFSDKSGVSYKRIVEIEKGIFPTDEEQVFIEKATDGFIKKEWWQEDIDALNEL